MLKTVSILLAVVLIANNSNSQITKIIGYSTTKVVGFKGNNNAIRFGVGFQFYLERKE